MTTAAVIAWLYATMLALVPPARAWQSPTHPETIEQRTERYHAIAVTIHAVAFDPSRSPLPGMSRRQSAGMLLAVAIGESGLALDTDRGPCYRGGRYRTRCDSGRAASMWQLWEREPLERLRYFGDRRAAAVEAHNRIGRSLNACRTLPRAQQLAAYGAGYCESDAGKRGSVVRWATYESIMARPVESPRPRLTCTTLSVGRSPAEEP